MVKLKRLTLNGSEDKEQQELVRTLMLETSLWILQPSNFTPKYMPKAGTRNLHIVLLVITKNLETTSKVRRPQNG